MCRSTVRCSGGDCGNNITNIPNIHNNVSNATDIIKINEEQKTQEFEKVEFSCTCIFIRRFN